MKMKQMISVFLTIIMLLGCRFPSRAEAEYYNGFYVERWDNSGIDYYTVYQNSYEREGAPSFYSEPRDKYNNIYTGWDVRITFFRQYDGATLAKADALCRYLMDHSSKKESYAGYYYFEDEGIISQITVYLIDGMNPNQINYDCQKLWDKNPWMNDDATLLVLEYLGYGLSEYTWQYAWNLGCSSAVIVQEYNAAGFPGVAFGFHFKEGTDDHIVRRYCPNETWW